MRWENLKNNECPYCGAELYRDGDTHQCTNCTFIIDSQRFMQILQHRARPERRGVLRMRWQNLRMGLCPVCKNDLKNGNGPYEIVQCVSAECTFHIREDSMQRILRDPTHPANRCAI